jgi:pilus assembly protein CpaE
MRVMVVSSNAGPLDELVRAAGHLLTVVSETEMLGFMRQESIKADLVVVDVRHSSQLPAFVPALHRLQPTLGVLIVAASLDPVMMLDAMRSGVSEFLAEPLQLNDLQAAIERLISASEMPLGVVVAFVGAKGGVGTTTTAVNVASELARVGSVLFIDMHLAGGDAAVFFGVEARFSVADALENHDRLDDAFLKGLVVKSPAGPDLLASPERTPRRPVDGTAHVRQLLEFAAHRYRFLVLDVARSDRQALEALDLARAIVVVATQELAAVRTAARLATGLRQEYGKDRVHVIVTRYHTDADIGQDDIAKAIGKPVRQVLPNDYRSAVHAINCGRPIVLTNHNKLSSSLQTLARELAGVTSKDAPPIRKQGLRGLFSGRS